MPSSDTVWFKSKLDWPVAAILVLVPLIQVAGLLSAVSSRDREAIIVNLISIGFVGCIYALLVMPIRYGISSDELLVHFGAVRQRIRFDAILEIYPSRSLLSSPALSFDRLAIKTGRGPLHLTLISPVPREEFLGLLAIRAGLAWDGRRWVHRHSSSSV